MMLILYVFAKFIMAYSKGICSSSSSSYETKSSFSDWVSSSLFFLGVGFDQRYFHSLQMLKMSAEAPAIPKANFTYFLCKIFIIIIIRRSNQTKPIGNQSISHSDALACAFQYKLLLLSPDFLFHLLLGLVDEGFVVSQIGHNIFREVVLDYGKVGNHWVDLLRSCLLCYHSKFMLLFSHWFSVFAEGICLLSDVQFWCFSTACLVRKRLPPFELLLETVLVELLQLLDSVRNTIGRRLFGLLYYFRWLLFFLLWKSSWVSEVVEVFGGITIVDGLQLHLLSHYFLEILFVPIILSPPLFYIIRQLHYSLRFFSVSIFFWHCLIFFSISLSSSLTSAGLFFWLQIQLIILADCGAYSFCLKKSVLMDYSQLPESLKPPPTLDEMMVTLPLQNFCWIRKYYLFWVFLGRYLWDGRLWSLLV